MKINFECHLSSSSNASDTALLPYNINSPVGKANMAERERKGKRLLDFTPQVAITLANKNSINTIFSMPSLALKFVFCVEICYDAHTLVSLSPNDAEHSKAKRSSFFCFLFFQWRKMSCSRKGVVVQVYTFVT